MDLIWLVAGIVPAVAGAVAAAGVVPGVGRGAERGLAAFVLAWAALTIGVESLGTLGRLDRISLVAWSLAAGGAGCIAAFLRRRATPSGPETPTAARPSRLEGAAVAATILVTWTALRLGIVSFVLPVKVVSDGPIYHLYFAARWWQAGRIEPVASPFGEAGATYFWANGELWYAWLMTLFGGDRFAKVGQVPFFLVAGAAVAALARTLGAGSGAARVAAAWFMGLGPFLAFAVEPNVDAILVAGYLLSTFFLVRAFLAEGPVPAGPLVLGALAAGLGMGTKPTGIVFFPPLIALATVGVIAREGRIGRWGRGWALGGAVLVASLAMMGYWPACNFLRTGNPLYPLHVEVGGRVLLAGWFGPDAMRLSPYYIPRADLRAMVDLFVSVADGRLALAWLAAALGAWAIRRSPATGAGGPARPTGRSLDRWVAGLAILGVLDLAAYWVVIPYRTQQRFCFPGFALLAVPLARLFDRSRWLRWAAVALLALHLLTPEAWPFGLTDAAIPWDLTSGVPNARPSPLVLPTSWASLADPVAAERFLATVLLGVAALGAVLLWESAGPGSARQFRRRAAALALLAPFGVAAARFVHAFDAPAFPVFADFYFGWSALDRLAGPDGARIAYAGNKIPYYLMGSGLRNRVRYVNVDEHRDWLMHDYHRNAPAVGQPATWPTPFPAWDRLQPDFDAWLANLRAERIDMLVVTRAVPEEGNQNYDLEGFPIERTWADRHPAEFRPIFGPGVPGSRIRIYQVLPPAKS